MHGRTTLLALALALLLPAVAHAADVTLHPGDRAPFDGVIESWSVQSPAPQTLELQVVQHLAGGGQVVTGASQPSSVAAGASGLDTRIAIGRDEEVVVSGAAPGTTVAALLQPDADGDGVADPEDGCPDDPTLVDGPCLGTRMFGSPLFLRPDPNHFSASGNPVDLLQTAGPAAAGAPNDGVLVRWRFRAASLDPLTLQVLHPAGGGAYTVAAESSSATPASNGAVTTADIRIPVSAGDRLGVRSPGDPTMLSVLPNALGEHIQSIEPIPAVGSTATPGSFDYDFRLLAQADVEPDADRDAYGDVSQDGCPFDGARHAGCTADLEVTTSQAAQVLRFPSEAVVDFTVVNHGPDPADHVRLAVTSGPGPDITHDTPAPCADHLWGTCNAVRLDPGATLSGRYYVSGGVGNTNTLTATASSRTPDPNAANDTATASMVWVVSQPPPPPPAPKPCANLIRGTTDDDVLRGTEFGDRLLGLDGKDLIRADGGDDCLEGGNGGDVLDGGAGNDRLNGGAGGDRLAGGTGDDRLTGSGGNDRLTGGTGNDTLLPGKGKDAVSAGAGNDTISAVDGVRESIDCGPGRDTVRADRRDRLHHCEKVTRVGRR